MSASVADVAARRPDLCGLLLLLVVLAQLLRAEHVLAQHTAMAIEDNAFLFEHFPTQVGVPHAALEVEPRRD